ncbi:DUF2612 domain-containing protein [Virgibacillus sediminis]|uniref:DUF2612 domain-containing protein n=1 Tax=Virgibacillus sediminis TaxID=202260 RepID=A0ABV7A6S5_9BACI
MYNIQDIMNRFASFLRKDPDSNLRKLMTIFSEQLQDLENTNAKIKEWRDIDNAEGQGLDQIGEIVRQSRGVASDEIYRVLLKAKNAQAYSDGAVNSVIKVISIALDIEPTQFKVTPKWNDADEPEEAAVKVLEVPVHRLNEVGLTTSQFSVLVQRTLSAGVRLDSIELSGTFSFGGIPIENDANAGFADIDGTTGGYFGTVFIPATDEELPL